MTALPTIHLNALPTIHLNGTGADTLEREYRAVRDAVDAAALALLKATCNQRDFYLQGPGAWQQARAERAEAFRLLGQLVDYAAQWQEHAAKARREREAL